MRSNLVGELAPLKATGKDFGVSMKKCNQIRIKSSFGEAPTHYTKNVSRGEGSLTRASDVHKKNSMNICG